MSHHECKFGRWYDGLDAKGMKMPPSMRKAETPHAALHALVRQIIEANQAGQRHKAESLFAELDKISTEIVACLDAAERELGVGAPT